MRSEHPADFVSYDPHLDQDMNETFANMIEMANQTGKAVVLNIGQKRFIIMPRMTLGRAMGAWKRFWQDQKGMRKIPEISQNLSDVLFVQEVFNVGNFGKKNGVDSDVSGKGHGLYYRSLCLQDPRTAQFISYWGKFLQLEQKKGEPLTPKLAMATMLWAAEKAEVEPTKQAQQLMTAIWAGGEKLADALGQNVSYCKVHRLVQNDENRGYYFDYKAGKMSLLGRKREEKAARMIAHVLGEPELVQAYYKIMINTKRFSPEERKQVSIPVLPYPEHTKNWNWVGYLKSACTTAKDLLTRATQKAEIKPNVCKAVDI